MAPRRPRRGESATTTAGAVGRSRPAIRACRARCALHALARVLAGGTRDTRASHVACVGSRRASRARRGPCSTVRPGSARLAHSTRRGRSDERVRARRTQCAVSLVEARRVAARRARDARGITVVEDEARLTTLTRGRARGHSRWHSSGYHRRPRAGHACWLSGRRRWLPSGHA